MKSSGKDELEKILISTGEKLKRYKTYEKSTFFNEKYKKLLKLYIVISNTITEKYK